MKGKRFPRAMVCPGIVKGGKVSWCQGVSWDCEGERFPAAKVCPGIVKGKRFPADKVCPGIVKGKRFPRAKVCPGIVKGKRFPGANKRQFLSCLWFCCFQWQWLDRLLVSTISSRYAWLVHDIVASFLIF